MFSFSMESRVLEVRCIVHYSTVYRFSRITVCGSTKNKDADEVENICKTGKSCRSNIYR